MVAQGFREWLADDGSRAADQASELNDQTVQKRGQPESTRDEKSRKGSGRCPRAVK